jgi:uncharacterized protein (DUF433 family)
MFVFADPPTITIPMQSDSQGVILVSGTRVTLDTIIACHHQGDTPEMIHEGFPTVPLTDIYAVIAYYLAHTAEIDAYLKQREEESARIRQEVEANYTPEQRARTEYFKALIAQKRKDQGR